MPRKSPVKPEETRAQLVDQIYKEARRLQLHDEDLIARLLVYFTHLDLRLIRDELREQHSRRAKDT